MVMAEIELDRARAARVAWIALGVGVFAGVVCLIGGIGRAAALERAYLQAVTYFLGLSLGALSWLMVQHLTRGGWGVLCRRVWEAAASTLPLFLLLLLPIFVNLSTLYPWANPLAIEAMEPRFASKVEDKATYFSTWFFWLRTLLVFAVFIALAGLLVRWSGLHDARGDWRLLRRMSYLSGPGLFIFGIAITFAVTDWWQSLEPAWYSTMYPVIWAVGFAVAALALAVALVVVLSKPGRALAPVLSERLYGHLGNLLLALVLLWIYVNFGQYLITWSGDLVDKVQWFVPRVQTSWRWVAASLVVLHFAVPFLVLVPFANRRSPNVLLAIAIALLILRAVDNHYLLAPSFHPEGVFVDWLDIATLIAVGGVWVAVFTWRLASRPLIPRASEALAPSPMPHTTP
jgi:hypothetical protein